MISWKYIARGVHIFSNAKMVLFFFDIYCSSERYHIILCLNSTIFSLCSLISEIMGSGREVHMSKHTSLIWQISFNGQRCDLQIHHCFLNDRPIACSWYIKNRKKSRSWSFYFLFKIFQTRDIIHSEKSGICSDGNRKLGFACWLQVEMVGKCQMQVFTYLISAHC